MKKFILAASLSFAAVSSASAGTVFVPYLGAVAATGLAIAGGNHVYEAAAAFAPAVAANLKSPEFVGAHFTTWHSDPGFCSNTPGLYAKWSSGLTVGAYRNSECKKYSAYAGWSWETSGTPLRAAVTVGLVTGYMQAPVMPLLVPSVVLDLAPRLSLRVTYVPKTSADSAHALNFAFQHSFGH